MAYIHKLINDDEKLVGIARLHWIYIVQGLLWFVALSGGGFLLSLLMDRGLAAMAQMSDSGYVAAPLFVLSNGMMLFMLVSGALIFLFHVIKVSSTSIALTNRRVIHKYGLIFVQAHQVDLEEIRGENLDLGYLGRLLGYGSIMLDCRFIGDIRLPAIENPEVFLRALDDCRAHTQDTLKLTAGKTGVHVPIDVIENSGQGEQISEISPPKPEPEVSPTPPDQVPTPPNKPMPEQPPPMNKIKPELEQRIQNVKQGIMDDLALKQDSRDRMVAPKSLEDVRKGDKEKPDISTHKTPVPMPANDQKNQAVLSREEISKVVEEMTPQIAQEVVKEMAREGFFTSPENSESDNKVDNDLIHVFDEAAFDKDGDTEHANLNKLEHSIH